VKERKNEGEKGRLREEEIVRILKYYGINIRNESQTTDEHSHVSKPECMADPR